jgi:hypothetical protein
MHGACVSVRVGSIPAGSPARTTPSSSAAERHSWAQEALARPLAFAKTIPLRNAPPVLNDLLDGWAVFLLERQGWVTVSMAFLLALAAYNA